MPQDENPVLTVAEVAAELNIAPSSVRTTMNRQGYYEHRGYLRSDVEAVKHGRRRKASAIDAVEES